jgi:hypothetical protein
MVKRLGSELILGPDRGLQEGWGIQFKEKLCWRKIFMLEGVVGITGVGMGVMWYCRKGDVQGAAGITAAILGIGTVVLGLAHGVSEGLDASRGS